MQNACNFMQASVLLACVVWSTASVMAAELQQTTLRRAAIVKILRELVVHKQDELVKLLKKQGFDVTQSSISRDLRELQVAKAGDRYIVANQAAVSSNPFAAVSHFVSAINTAGSSLTVIKTTTGHAQSVAVAIDEAEWPEVVGTISGDDTIFIATNDGKAQQQLGKRLRAVFNV